MHTRARAHPAKPTKYKSVYIYSKDIRDQYNKLVEIILNTNFK